MTGKFTHEAAAINGYSFIAGRIHSFQNRIGEAIIRDGVAYQVASRENGKNQTVDRALFEAKQRDLG